MECSVLITDERFRALTEQRARQPGLVAAKAVDRRRRPLLGDDGRLVLIAADHPARRILGVGTDPFAMADRRALLERTVTALRRPGVDGLLATPDVLEDLLLLDELDDKVLIGSMNRGGLTGSVWELDDRFTAYDAERILTLGLDGGKMLLRLDLEDPGTLATMEGCAHAVTALAERERIALVEPLPAFRDEGDKVRISADLEDLVAAVAVGSSLGATSAYTWLKLPAPTDPARMLAATTLPTLLLGGDPGADAGRVFSAWRDAMTYPQVRGLVAGRSLLYPDDGDVARAVDAAVEIVHGTA
jgi:hypothetical protein